MQQDPAKPMLTVVIPTLGRPFVVRTLASLAAAEGFADLEVLLVGKIQDPAVAEEIRALSERYPQIQHLPVAFTSGDSSQKKNIGWRTARADIVAFLDDDVEVMADWVIKILEPFEASAVGLVSGPSLVPEDIPLAARLAGQALSSLAAGYVAHRYLRGQGAPREVGWSQIIGCNMACRKDLLLSLGGFDPSFWPGEEMIAAYQATGQSARIIFHPQACVFHYPRISLGSFLRQMMGYGATRIRLIRAGVAIEPSTLLPGLGILGLLILLPGALVSPWLARILGVGLMLYAALVIGATLLKLGNTRRWADLLLLLYIPLMHLSYGIGEWLECLRPNRDLSQR
ncbi:MAG: glycosyltransferase [Lentisphaerae bacterium]|nr:glycosyltransferase [Lentisphaerota bacterium]